MVAQIHDFEKDIQAALIDIQSNQARIKNAASQIEQAALAQKLSVSKLKNGTATPIEITSTNADYQRALLNQLQYQYQLCNAQLELIKLTTINLSRFAQLTQKTNQFNLTTKRYSETDISNLVNLGYWVYGLSVKDKFGDSGITGLIIIKFENKSTVEIDSFLMSCRVLGKNIENEFLKVIN